MKIEIEIDGDTDGVVFGITKNYIMLGIYETLVHKGLTVDLLIEKKKFLNFKRNLIEELEAAEDVLLDEHPELRDL
jgi:hypothetical protein